MLRVFTFKKLEKLARLTNFAICCAVSYVQSSEVLILKKTGFWVLEMELPFLMQDKGRMS